MFKKLLVYNWKLFRHSLSGTKLLVLVTYGILLGLIFSELISTVYVIITLRATELGNVFSWYTPRRGQFILLAFANLLWLIQFFFTNIRLIRLEENRKLLVSGFPLQKLSRYLNTMALFHPLNLLFNASWFLLLMLQFGNPAYLPVAAALVALNFALIFSLKFRLLSVIKKYQKGVPILALTVLFILGLSLSTLFSNTFSLSFEEHLSTINHYLLFLPGGFLAIFHTLSQSVAVQVSTVAIGGVLCYLLHRDHIRNISRELQRHPPAVPQPLKTGWLRKWLCSQLGHHGGKYLYYVITHPYNKIQALLILVFPILYVPFMVSHMQDLGTTKFILYFFFMYAPMGFQLIFLGNMFGYEHRELLREMQFPIPMDRQLKERLKGAIIIPLTLLAIITGAEFIILREYGSFLSIMLANILLFEIFLGIFLWSTFSRYKKVRWVSFSLSQPVISQSVQFITGFAMFALCALFYISYGSYETYKQIAMLLLVAASGFWIYRFIDNIQERFAQKISPHLWNEL